MNFRIEPRRLKRCRNANAPCFPSTRLRVKIFEDVSEGLGGTAMNSKRESMSSLMSTTKEVMVSIGDLCTASRWGEKPATCRSEGISVLLAGSEGSWG